MLLVAVLHLVSAVAVEAHTVALQSVWSRPLVVALETQRYCSVAQLCPAPWDPMNCSTPDFPVLHYLLESAQTHVH